MILAAPFRAIAFALTVALWPLGETVAQTASDGPAMPATESMSHPLAGAVIDVRAGERISAEAMLEALRSADVVIIGETHDNPDHHAAQAWLVRGLAPGGLAFEMIPPRLEMALAKLRRDRASDAEIGAALEWEARGWPDWAMYAPILSAAPDAVVSGGAVEREALAIAMRDGALAGGRTAIGAAAARYGLAEPLADDTLAEATAEQVAAHCDAIPEQVAARMVDAQRLRDAAFADAVLRARALAQDAMVALIAGRGHARADRGVPPALRAARPDLRVATVAMAELGEAEEWRPYAPDAADGPPFDFLWFTAAAEREDPCVAFLRARQ
jgi:uncharacterized iron-regulated protein